MIWFKETYRALNANPRMSLTDQGALWNLCRYAWDRQGITEDDLYELARTLREPLEIFRDIWPDFVSIAEEKDGKWMLPEQWQGLEKYTQKRITGEEMIKRRWDKRKNSTFTENKGLTDTKPNTAVYTVPYTDLDIDIDKEPSVNKKEIVDRGGVGDSSAKTPKSPRRQTVSEMPDDEWLDSLQQNPAYAALNVRMIYAKALTWCETTKRRKCTRRFFINWLNREEQPLQASYNGASHNSGGQRKVVF